MTVDLGPTADLGVKPRVGGSSSGRSGRRAAPAGERPVSRSKARARVVGPPVRPVVTAVLVSHDGAAFLRRTLDAVAAQTRPPDCLVAVDTGSRDDGPDLLLAAVPQVLRLPRRTSFGDAVRAALTVLDQGGVQRAEQPRPGLQPPSAVPAADQPTASEGAEPEDPADAGAAAEAVAAEEVATEAVAAEPVAAEPVAEDGPAADDAADQAADDAADQAADDAPDDVPEDGPEGAAEQVQEWVWLLHDDSAPEPDALARLLAAADTSPSASVLGCKQVAWDDGTRLLDVGFTTSRLGKRVTGVDIDDVDQGQLDHRSDVLAVSTAGMLVRRDVWDHLGGPDPALAHARDDLDLCRRAHLAGHRVVVVPGAVMAHADATAAGRRRRGGRSRWPRADRRDALHLRLAAAPLPLLPLVLLWSVLAGAVRAVGRLALKQPDRAADELAALVGVLVRPAAWWRARGRLRRVRVVPGRAVRRLHAAPRQVVRQRRDAVSAHLRAQEAVWLEAEERRRLELEPAAPSAPAGPAAPPATRGADAAGTAPLSRKASAPARPVESGPVDPESESLPAGSVRRVPAPWVSAAAAVLPAALAGLVALHTLLRSSGTVMSPVLLPAPERTADLWQAATTVWRSVGLGASAFPDPLAAVLAALSLPFGSPRTLVLVLLLTALPLAALTGWLAAGAVTRSRALRTWAALAWAAAPTLLASVGAGRIGPALAHVVLPLVALGVARAVGVGGRLPDRGSLTAASGAGLALTVVLAGAPSLAVPALVAVVAVVAVARCGRALLGWTVALPAVLLLPWWEAVVRHPRLLVAEPGLPTGGSGTPPEATWHVLLLPGDPAALLTTGGAPYDLLPRLFGWLPGAEPAVLLRGASIALVVPLLGLALVGVLRRDRRGLAAAAAWVAALGGLTVAVLAPRLWVAPVVGGGGRGWWGPGVSLMLLGVLVAVLCRLDGAARRLRRRSLGLRHGAAVGLGLLMVLGPVLSLVGWSWHTAGSLGVHLSRPDVLPAVAAAEATGPAGTRTLVLRVTGRGTSWSLLRAPGPQLGDDSAALAARRADRRDVAEADDQVVLPVLGALLSDTGVDVRDRLADLAVGSVLLLPPVDDASVLALDAAPGLVRVGSPDGAVLWRVELPASADGPTRPTRVRVLAPDGSALQALPSQGLRVDAELPAGPPGRALVLAERADPAWHARLDGRELVPAQHAGWAQAFLLPTSGGHLVVAHEVRGQHLVELARWSVLALGLLAAVPIPSRRRRVLVAAGRSRADRVAARRPGGGGRRPAGRDRSADTGRAAERARSRATGPGRSPRRRPDPGPAFELPELPDQPDRSEQPEQPEQTGSPEQVLEQIPEPATEAEPLTEAAPATDEAAAAEPTDATDVTDPTGATAAGADPLGGDGTPAAVEVPVAAQVPVRFEGEPYRADAADGEGPR